MKYPKCVIHLWASMSYICFHILNNEINDTYQGHPLLFIIKCNGILKLLLTETVESRIIKHSNRRPMPHAKPCMNLRSHDIVQSHMPPKERSYVHPIAYILFINKTYMWKLTTGL